MTNKTKLLDHAENIQTVLESTVLQINILLMRIERYSAANLDSMLYQGSLAKIQAGLKEIETIAKDISAISAEMDDSVDSAGAGGRAELG